MAEVPSASVAAASSPSPRLQDREHASRRHRSLLPGTCCNTTLTHSTIGLQASASDTKDMTNSLHGSLHYCIKKRKGKPAVSYFNRERILTVNSDGYCFHKRKLKDRYSVHKYRDELCISAQTTLHGGTYTVCSDGKTSTFKHQKSRKQAELMETCEVQNCSHEPCSCYVSYPSLVESPVPQVKESFWKELELLNCVEENLIRNESKTVTTMVHHDANATDPPSTGTSSTGNVAVAVGVTGLFVLLLFLFLVLFYKYGVTWMKGRCRGSAGSQDDSHGAAGDMDTQAEESV